MKAERRHDLQTNTLDRTIRNLPEYWREHGSKIALAVIAILLVIVLVRMYFTNRAEKSARVAENLSLARSAISSLRDSIFWSSERMSAADVKKRTDEVRRDVDNSLNQVLEEATDPAQQAEANVLRGDLYYGLYMIGEMPEAATQPSLRPDKRPEEMLKLAEDRYKEVLAQSGSLPATLVARARFGLAAVAENHHKWDAAQAHYEAIQKDASLGPALRDQAQGRISELKELQKERVIGRPRPQEEVRSTTGPTTLPTSNPVKVSL
jgi:hypothetical protein